jgi:hypothetical protein
LRIAVSLLALAMLPAPVWAGRKPIAAPALTLEHRHPSGAFNFKTPEGWTVGAATADAFEAWSGELGVRFLYHQGESGLDSLHATCILEGLAPLGASEPQLKYEYEYVGGVLGNRRVLDSAHSMRYDDAVRGQRDWRQRTVTVVGAGESVCVMSYAPVAAWKKQPETRALLEAVMGSLTFTR